MTWTELLLVGVLHEFPAGSGFERDLATAIERFAPQVVCVEVPPPAAMRQLYRYWRTGLAAKARRAAQRPSCPHHAEALACVARGDQVGALAAFTRARLMAPEDESLAADEAEALRLCSDAALLQVVLPLRVRMGFEVVPVGGTRYSHFGRRAEAVARWRVQPDYEARHQAEAALMQTAYAGLCAPRLQASLLVLNSGASHVVAEVAHGFLRRLWGTDDVDLCWRQNNANALRAIRQAVERSAGRRVAVLHGWEHVYWLLPRLQALAQVRVVPLADLL